MPAYFFHLAFELRQSLSVVPTPSSRDPQAAVFSPPPNLDIFNSELPAHSCSTWASYIAPPKGRSRPPKEFLRASPNRIARTSPPHHRPSSVKEKLDRQQDQASLPETVPSTICSQDWRIEEITIESVNMEPASPTQFALSETNAQIASQIAAHALAVKGKYLPSNPQSTNVGYGVVHLYRDVELANELSTESSGTTAPKEHGFNKDEAFVDSECTTLCILAVPSYMTPSDLLGWVGDKAMEQVSHFRLIRTGRSNKYMVLIKFREAKMAKQWQRDWNGKLFNSMEPENCHVVFIQSVQFQTVDENTDPTNFPDMSNDPFTPSKKTIEAPANSLENAGKAGGQLTSKPAPPPTPSLLELPTCPVCLERMDETTGLATIFCQHVFHCACLQKWRGSGCPVCRYTQEDLISKTADRKVTSTECTVCSSKNNLWICLICGHVGCGRYDDAHAFAHYERTSHTFAMDIETQHIWDYAGDEYVHRLIQNQSDGKLVELPAAGHITGGGETAHRASDKIENMSLEYTHLLTSQLDSQRMYFEEQVERAVDKASKASTAAEQAADRAIKAYSRLEALEATNGMFANDTIPNLEREKDRAERRAQKAESTARTMQTEWREKSVINDSLMERITHLESQLAESQAKTQDLEEQNRDLSFFISGMEKLKGSGEEVQEGTVSIADAPAQAGNKKKKKTKRNKPAQATSASMAESTTPDEAKEVADQTTLTSTSLGS